MTHRFKSDIDSVGLSFYQILTLVMLTLAFLMLFTSSTVLAAERVALVIGNENYKKHQVKHAKEDALLMKEYLESIGFSVVYRENLAKSNINATLKEFSDQLKAGTEALIFYKGHALQVKGSNYLCAVDVKAKSAKAVQQQSIHLNQLIDSMREAGVSLNLVFVDASWKSPFSRKVHDGVQGLAKIRVQPETFVLFSAGPGVITRDFGAKQGLYTDNLVLAMKDTKLPFEQALKKFKGSISKLSKGRQHPWQAGRVNRDYFFTAGMTSSKEPRVNMVLPKPASLGDAITESVGDMTLVYIPAGEFVMGSPESELNRYDDEVQHKVKIQHGFWMGKHEVTFDQYEIFREATNHAKPRDVEGWSTVGNRPVTGITWFEATAFANWLSGQTGYHYRLPTEAEWEYAARAGTTTAFSFGDNPDDSVDYAWNGKIADKQTHPVGLKKPNPWGLHDIHGNVWEWTATVYSEDYDGSEQRDDSLEVSYDQRSTRGGSWYFYPKGMRSADRRLYNPKQRLAYIGFRLIREQ
ncbi:MAG: SUMF1/EgtB/PvdO family nonheme iron enzyme [Mariprofundaceae bacterium]